MKKFFAAIVFALFVAVFNPSNVSAQSYSFSAGGYDYLVMTICSDLSVMFNGWDKVYQSIVAVYRNAMPQSSSYFTFAQKDGTWYYRIEDGNSNFAPISNNTLAQSIFNSMQQQIADFKAEVDTKRKAYTLYGVAEKYLEAKFYEPAIVAFEEYKKFDPTAEYFYVDNKIADCYLAIADEHFERKNYKNAIENYEKAASLYEIYKADYLKRFSTQMDSDRFEKAPVTTAFRRDLYSGLAISYSALGDKQKAIYNAKKFNEYLKDGEKPFILREMQNLANETIAKGDALFKAKNYREAINVYESALANSPENHDLYFKIALSYRNLKEYDKAIWKIERAMSIVSEKLRTTTDKAEQSKLNETLQHYQNRIKSWRISQQGRTI